MTETACQAGLPSRQTTLEEGRPTLVTMVVRIGPKKLRRRRIYLKEHREDAGLTQEQLAERLDTTKATISRIETGARDWTGSFLDAAAEALGKPDGSVFYYPPDDQKLANKLASAPENVRKQVHTVIEALLRAGERR